MKENKAGFGIICVRGSTKSCKTFRYKAARSKYH